MTELKIIYVSQNSDNSILYLYDKANKVILPIETEIPFDNAEIFDCFLKSIFNIMKIKKGSFEIYKHQDETFYWYLKIKTSRKTYKINCNSELFSYFSRVMNFPVYAPQRIIEKQGIHITEDFLNATLIG